MNKLKYSPIKLVIIINSTKLSCSKFNFITNKNHHVVSRIKVQPHTVVSMTEE